MKKLNQKGIAHVFLTVFALAVIGFVGFAGWQVYHKHKTGAAGDGQAKGEADAKKDCSGTGKVEMKHEPMDMSDVSFIAPAGLLAGAHVTPIDHLYFYPKDMQHRDAAPVYAMADGFITSYQERTQKVDNGAAQQGEFRITIQHNCSITSYFDLLTSLDSSIKDKLKGGDTHVPVKAGQVIGRVGAQSLDTAIYNYDMKLTGFVNPDSYASESWKIHLDNFFAYWDGSPSLKGEMLAKNIRKVEPFGGKIDYDIDGKLIGNWFQVGTNGYAGPKELQNKPGSGGTGYWSGHLSIAPDAVTPTQINISFGDYQGKATQFTAKAGSPDPATIGTDSGLVKYELVQYQQPNPTQGVSTQQTTVMGTVLFQLTAKRMLKMEAFPGKTADQVTAFTSAAKSYER